jgi:uncharacterized protein (TIGR04255 family)
MSDFFPIPSPDRLPSRIDPCPIVEAVLEIRFITSESWSVLPGLLYSQIRDRYAEKRDLPLMQIPEEIRRQDQTLTHLPLVQFVGERFLIQFGPRVVSLNTKQNRYPGWAAIDDEIAWMLDRLEKASLITEGERLGVRYIDFFFGDIFPNLILGARVGESALDSRELVISTVLRRAPFTARLQVMNSAIVGTDQGPKTGSVLDLDVWAGPLDFDLFKNGRQRFADAHIFVKHTFFGLLRPPFLASLNPVY